MKSRAAPGVRRGPQTAAVRLDDGSADRLIGSPMPVPSALVVKKGLENLLRLLRRQSHTRIAD